MGVEEEETEKKGAGRRGRGRMKVVIRRKGRSRKDNLSKSY